MYLRRDEELVLDVDEVLGLVDELDVCGQVNAKSERGHHEKDAQAFWILCSVRTPCDQSETLRTTCTLHVLGFGGWYGGSGSSSSGARCQYCR